MSALWNWLSKPRNQKTLAVIGSGIAGMAVAIWTVYQHVAEEKPPPAVSAVSATSKGIAAGRDVTAIAEPGGTAVITTGNVEIGITLEEHRDSLMRREEEIKSELSKAHREEKDDLTKQLQDVQKQLAKPKESYETRIEFLQERVVEVDKLKGKFPERVLATAKAALARGDISKADALVRQNAEKADPPIKQPAEVAYESRRPIEYRGAYVVCVPDRPVAHPGERLTVTAWVNGSLNPATKDIKWRSSVGTITGNRAATWTFPNDDTRVSTEVPATARALVRHAALGQGQCEVRVYFVRQVVMRGENPPPLLSGRTFLLPDKKEPEGYGLYSYILFGSPPGSDTERERYLKGIESYLQVVQPNEELERYRDPHELNITLIPLKVPIDLNRNLTEPKQARELAVKLLSIYDYARAQVLLTDFGLDATTSGPFLVSKRHPAMATQADRTVIDMSRVSPTLVSEWTKGFCNLATQESSWTEATLRKLELNVQSMRNAPPKVSTAIQIYSQ